MAAADPSSDPFQLRSRGITDTRVLAAMARVPRERFVPTAYRAESFADNPLPIGFGQTISQPFIVAWMTQELTVTSGMRVLEIGTGSGYQTAILAELGADLWSIEILPDLAARAQHTLVTLGYEVHLRVGSGYAGWPEAAPFDRILLTAAPPALPDVLVRQLGDGGRMIAPVGVEDQVIVVVERSGATVSVHESVPVRFVPMT